MPIGLIGDKMKKISVYIEEEDWKWLKKHGYSTSGVFRAHIRELKEQQLNLKPLSDLYILGKDNGRIVK